MNDIKTNVFEDQKIIKAKEAEIAKQNLVNLRLINEELTHLLNPSTYKNDTSNTKASRKT